MWILIGSVLLLIVVMGLGWVGGTLIHRAIEKRTKSDAEEEKQLERMTDTIAFVSGAVGILLGLLLSISVGEFQDTQNNIKQLGTDALATFSASESFDEADREDIQRDVVCGLRSFINHDWKLTGDAQADGSQQTTLWMMKLHDDVANLPIDTTQQSESYSVLVDKALDLANSRHLILSSSMATIPMVIWIVIYFSAFVLSLLLTLHLADRKILAWVSLSVSFGTLAVVIVALTALDYPLQNLGVGTPTSTQVLTNELESLEWQYPGNTWTECPELTVESANTSD